MNSPKVATTALIAVLICGFIGSTGYAQDFLNGGSAVPEASLNSPTSVLNTQSVYLPDCLLAATAGRTETSGWQYMPAGLMYHSYLAGMKEPRFNTTWLRDQNGKFNWENQLGGRVGIIRYGDFRAVNPNGWQLDLEGGGQVRLLPDQNTDVEAVDFRVGFLLTRRKDLWSWKTGYYHISAHVGDEFLIAHPGFNRLNYVRDAGIIGVSRDIEIAGRPDMRVYGEYAYAFNHEVGKPNEFQFGVEYSPLLFNGWRGSPFWAVNGSFREDRNWDAKSINMNAGWQWRNEATNHRFRIGGQLYDGDSPQYSFPGKKETMYGWGMWFDY
ncbi:MAG: DUF1207 domain-containing protein [Pirellulales bacterium]